ncbi:death-associated inhibitor of apoptosis 2 [Plodia interpunctella]|uniref:death-associated inhibitor of apoptosis 2 n=1 Tax=Plodia interpunctella TaxID=58824 RepID=UPI002368467C|nr:death-associated inhibitor of apoptosis 2 [Plodia interpunctella]XP_053604903.1 death-associated inhibitor of apoptosis 2 [Plodia interpunctella]
MNYETNRLNTFSSWPASALVDPIRIAKAGFYYTGEGTEVQCFSCGGKISHWNYGDQVMWRHRHMEPNCEFVVNPRQSGNVPLVLGSECPSTIDSSTSWTAEEQNERVESHDYGLTEEDEVYKSDPLRLLSFINWNDPSVSREALVSAGFYHVGEGRLRCAWCGGELAPFRRFGSLGTPLEVHRMYFPRCEHAATLEAARRTNHLSPPASPTPETTPIQTPPDTTDHQSQSTGAEHNARLLESGGTWRTLGVVGGVARHPAHASLAARLASYEGWPADRTQLPCTLAEAGFFYTGTGDQVRCFYCDGGLGLWEAGDAPWSEHANWFPHCGYVLLIKGQEYVDQCRSRSSVQRTFSADSGLSSRRRNPGVNFPITESQVEEGMESTAALAALGAGLDAARVRRAIARRLRATGLPFSSSEALIDAVLDEQLNEEAWSVTPQSQRFARDILAETLRDFAPISGLIPTQWDDRPDSRISTTSSTRSVSPLNVRQAPSQLPSQINQPVQSLDQTGQPSGQNSSQPSNHTSSQSSGQLLSQPSSQAVETSSMPQTATSDIKVIKTDRNKENPTSPVVEKKHLSLEEENRQLKEARLCKVCMDSEVSVVFLPCGHLVSCARCGAALAACPLCRCAVRALVRAYLA